MDAHEKAKLFFLETDLDVTDAPVAREDEKDAYQRARMKIKDLEVKLRIHGPSMSAEAVAAVETDIQKTKDFMASFVHDTGKLYAKTDQTTSSDNAFGVKATKVDLLNLNQVDWQTGLVKEEDSDSVVLEGDLHDLQMKDEDDGLDELSGKPTVTELVNDARTEMNKGYRRFAILHLNKAINMDPDNWTLYLMRSRCYILSGGRSDSAIRDANRVIDLNPTCAMAYLLRGKGYFEQRRWEEALQSYYLGLQYSSKHEMLLMAVEAAQFRLDEENKHKAKKKNPKQGALTAAGAPGVAPGAKGPEDEQEGPDASLKSVIDEENKYLQAWVAKNLKNAKGRGPVGITKARRVRVKTEKPENSDSDEGSSSSEDEPILYVKPPPRDAPPPMDAEDSPYTTQPPSSPHHEVVRPEMKIQRHVREYPPDVIPILNLVQLYNCEQDVRNLYEGNKWEQSVKDVTAIARRHFMNTSIQSGSAVVFDIDETLISGYSYMVYRNFDVISKFSKEYIDQATAPAIIYVRKLYKFFLKRGYKIFIITGRKEGYREKTIENLDAAQYTKYEKLIMRPDDERLIENAEYKAREREKLHDQGYKICCTVGDQHTDFAGAFVGFKVKIPNYLYKVM